MVLLHVLGTKKYDYSIAQVRNLFINLQLFNIKVTFSNFNKVRDHSTHFSLLKSPHIYKNAMMQYTIVNDPTALVSLFYKYNTLNSSLVSFSTFYNLDHCLYLLNTVFLNNSINIINLIRLKMFSFNTNGLSIKAVCLNHKFIFTIYN